MSASKFKISVLLLSVILGCWATGCKQKQALAVRQIDKIYFLSNRDAPQREFDIFSMNVDGSDQINLTRHVDGIRSFSKPCISSDCKTVIFATDTGSKKMIQALYAGDSIATPLTDIRVNTPQLRFSPDDRYILFSDKVDTLHQIFIMNRDGSNRRKLSQSNFDDSNASFSPDGAKICYQTKLKHTTSIGLMNLDGSKQQILTDDAGNDVSPAFSSDGSYILFASDRKGTMDIFMVKIVNQQLIPLYNESSHDSSPLFMPDGRHVLFSTNKRGFKFRDLALLDIKSGLAQLLTETEYKLNQHPLIMPDGESIVFESTNFIRSDIMKVEVGSLKLTNLTNNPKWDQMPVY